ncbi:MAG: ribosome maturation factor RimM [Terracidiphilus sp.]|jgi:16S rRNA processing protein RimM
MTPGPASESASGPAPASGASAPSGPQDWVWLARIRRPQGRKGEVFADLLTDFPEKFAERKQLWLLAEPSASRPAKPATGLVSGHDFSRAAKAAESTRALAPAGTSPASISPREVELINYWPHKGGIVLQLAGVDSISAAETLKGLVVAIPRSERAALAEDEVYIGDLIGCSLIDVASAVPQTIGEIESVDRTAGPVALLVARGAAGEVLIPFAKIYLRKIDLNAKRVEMALPRGLVELNHPG